MKRGRVIVQIKSQDGKPVSKEANTSKKISNFLFFLEWGLLKIIGSTILKYKEKPETSTAHVEDRKKKRRKK